MEAPVVAAIISGSVAFCAAILTLLAARWQTNLKTKELESTTRELESDLESMRQSQLSEIIKKRIEVYPKLWTLLLTYNLHWELAGKPKDYEWAKEHLAALNNVNAELGLFFSQDLYEHFNQYRAALLKINNDFAAGHEVSKEDLNNLETIITGKDRRPGLASYLKDDLGSYREAIITARQPKVATNHSKGA